MNPTYYFPINPLIEKARYQTGKSYPVYQLK